MCDPVQAISTLMDKPEGLDSESVNSVLRTADKARMNGVRGFLASDIDPGLVDANNDGVVDSKDGKINMTRYLTGGRVFGLSSIGYGGFQDGGEAFGRMLSQASIKDMDADMNAPDPKAYAGGKGDPEYIKARDAFLALKQDDLNRAKIASNFMAGYQDGLDKWADDLNGENAFGRSNSALRSYAGTIIAPHMGGVSDAIKDQGSGVAETGAIEQTGGHAVAKFTSLDANRFKARGGIFQDLAFDNPKLIDAGDPKNPFDDKYENGRLPALQTLRIAAHENYMHDLDVANRTGDHRDRVEALKQVVKSWGDITDSLYVAKADAGTAMAKAMDLQNQRWKDGIGAVLNAVPFADFVNEGAKCTKYAIGQGTGQIAPAVLDKAFSTDNEIGASLEAAKEHGEAGKVIYGGLYKTLASRSDGWETCQFENTTAGAPIDFSTPNYDLEPFVKDGRILSYAEMDRETRDRYETWVRRQTDYGLILDEGSEALETAKSNRQNANELVEAAKKQKGER